MDAFLVNGKNGFEAPYMEILTKVLKTVVE